MSATAMTPPGPTKDPSPRRKPLVLGVIGAIGLALIGPVASWALAGAPPPAKWVHSILTDAPHASSVADVPSLASVSVCGVVQASSSLGRQLTAERVVIVDGRCDDDPAAPVGVYATPSQAGVADGHVSTGEVLHAMCVVPQGERLANLRWSSSRWIEVVIGGQSKDIPEVWTAHGDLPSC